MDVCVAKQAFCPKRQLELLDAHKAFLLSFEKGEFLEVLEDVEDGTNKTWLGVRALKNNAIGYIPVNYVKVEKAHRVCRDEKDDTREIHLLALEELKKRPEFQHPDKLFANAVIPDPDYSDSEDEDSTDLEEPFNNAGKMSPHPNRLALTVTGTTNGHMTTDDGLVLPRKLANPCLESKEKQNLHRELLFNQKIGKNVLAQKSELKKAMDKFQSDQKKKEQEMEKLNKRTSLEKKLEEQAQKLKMVEQQQSISEKTQESEFHRIHAKLRSTKVDPQ